MIIAGGVIMATSMSFLAPTKDGKYALTAGTKLNWSAAKVTATHTGTVQVKSGNVSIKGGIVTAGTIVMNMETINCTDMGGEYALCCGVEWRCVHRCDLSVKRLRAR